MDTNKKRTVMLAVFLVALAAALAAVWWFNRPETSAGSKTITVEVVHKDESKKTFTCTTTEEYLAPVLVSEGIVEDNQQEYGLYILVTDGERADYAEDGAYWSLRGPHPRRRQLFPGLYPCVKRAAASPSPCPRWPCSACWAG